MSRTTLKDLREQAAERELSTEGTKAELAARIAEHDQPGKPRTLSLVKLTVQAYLVEDDGEFKTERVGQPFDVSDREFDGFPAAFRSYLIEAERELNEG